MKGYRVGKGHKVTIIEFDESETPDKEGRRPSDQLIATAQSPEKAQFINRALAHWRKFEDQT
jgi:hypothetical protein